MKLKFLGAFLMLIGSLGIVIGLGVIVSASNTLPQPEKSVHEEAVTVEAGKYYLGGDKNAACLEIFDDETFLLDGYVRMPYQMKIWYNMPVTDEKTGYINLVDYYFIGTNLDGGTDFSEKLPYDYEKKALEYKGDKYYLA